MNKNDFKHGQTQVVDLEIMSIAQNLNKYGKLSIRVQKTFPYEKDVIMLTAEHVSKLAEDIGAQNRFTLAQAVNGCPNDPSYLTVKFTFKKKGEKIGNNADGSPIISKTTGKDVHDKDYWDSEIVGVQLGGEAAQYANNIVSQQLVQMGLEQMKGQDEAAKIARKRRLGLTSSDDNTSADAKSESAKPEDKEEETVI